MKNQSDYELFKNLINIDSNPFDESDIMGILPDGYPIDLFIHAPSQEQWENEFTTKYEGN